MLREWINKIIGQTVLTQKISKKEKCKRVNEQNNKYKRIRKTTLTRFWKINDR